MSEFVRLLRRLTRGHRRTFFLAVSGAATYATCTVVSSWAVRRVIDSALGPRFDEGSVESGRVTKALLVLVLIGVVKATGVVIRRSFAGVTEWRAAGTLASDVVDAISRRPVAWLRGRPAGEMVGRLTVDAEAAVAILAPLPFASSVIVLLVLAAVAMLMTDLYLGLVGLLVMPVVLFINLRYQKRVDAYFAEAQDHLGDLSSAVHESFEAVSVVKAFGAEEREARRLSRVAEKLRDARIATVRLRSIFESLLDTVPALSILALLVLGAWRVDSGAMTVGEIAGFVYLFTLLTFPLRLIGYALSELPHSRAGLSRIEELLTEGDASHKTPVPAVGVGVEIMDLTVSYPLGDRPVLSIDNLVVPPGTKIAIVGETGSGKTTLVLALSGLVPFAGSVRVAEGGVAPVFQEPFLLAASLKTNLTFDDHRSDDEMRRSLEIACADFVDDLPDGWNTVVGERGVGLSGGQRQRIALARAILSRRRVLVLDDTTSALDPETELAVVGRLMNDCPNTTMVVVASRPSTVALLDEVAFLADGRLVDRGSHEELLARNDRYRRIMESYESDRKNG